MEVNTKKMLPVQLDDKELLDRARQLTVTMGQAADIEFEAKLAKERFKEDLITAGKEVGRLRAIVASGYEDQMVSCRWEFDYKLNKKSLIRQDTGEIVESCALTESERQLALDVATPAE